MDRRAIQDPLAGADLRAGNGRRHAVTTFVGRFIR
jgi:hypothetical protein